MLPQLSTEDVLFHVLGAGAVLSAVAVVLLSNPVYCALFLALCMSLLGVVFFTLGAYFIAAAQITVYAGAVMVLFVMVLMLFDLRKDPEDLLPLSIAAGFKIVATGLLCGFLVGAGWLSRQYVNQNPIVTPAPQTTAQDLSKDKEPMPQVAATAGAGDEVKAETQSEESEDLVVDPKTLAAEPVVEKKEISSTLSLSQTLFSKWVVAFEVLGLVILLVTVGVVALAKSRGGTHHAG